ncbi:hypothetical protein JW916_00370 [Candidatus Sumerlaeota bacterium]|nr:hypothetical protein [Candidatus Sumerlaeota bacterium]
MSPRIRFYTCDTESLLHIVGSADRALLRDIGVELGVEFLALEEEDVEEPSPDQEEAEEPDWDAEAEEISAGQEAIAKMIMSGMPADLSEDEAHAVQDYLASYALRSDQATLIDANDLIDCLDQNHDEETADFMRRMILEGIALDEMIALFDWLEKNGASHDVASRLQMLAFGRLPEADEPTFTDLEEDAYTARFGYLTSEESAHILDETYDLAKPASKELGPLPLCIVALLDYCNTHATDLAAIVDD